MIPSIQLIFIHMLCRLGLQDCFMHNFYLIWINQSINSSFNAKYFQKNESFFTCPIFYGSSRKVPYRKGLSPYGTVPVKYGIREKFRIFTGQVWSPPTTISIFSKLTAGKLQFFRFGSFFFFAYKFEQSILICKIRQSFWCFLIEKVVNFLKTGFL